MTKNQLSEFELEREGFKIRIQRNHLGRHEAAATPIAQQPVLSQSLIGVSPSVPAAISAPLSDVVEIKSPMVGTFYRSPAPDAPAYVQVGQEVNEETVVCIIEAMKVMNEIKAEVKGTIVEMLVENAKPVEFNTPLFRVKKAAS